MIFSITFAFVICGHPSWANNIEDRSLVDPKASVDNPGGVPLHGALIWAEEFDGPLDLTTSDHIGRWRPNDQWQDVKVGYKDFAGDSWNINPNQHPLYSPFMVADGVLTITATKIPKAIVPSVEALVGPGKAPKWSGGILITDRLKRSFKYGYFEIRARFPNPGKGMFPAIWLYAADGTVGDPRKSGAEIDIFEVLGSGEGRPWQITVHRRDWQGRGDQTDVGSFNSDTAEWHTYGLDWQPSHLRFYRDGVMVGQVTGADASWFDVEMAIRLNFAVDGNHLLKLGHVSDRTTPEVMKMQVDYVRVFAVDSGAAVILR
jgi:beta-glucanase (GH16 family)